MNEHEQPDFVAGRLAHRDRTYGASRLGLTREDVEASEQQDLEIEGSLEIVGPATSDAPGQAAEAGGASGSASRPGDLGVRWDEVAGESVGWATASKPDADESPGFVHRYGARVGGAALIVAAIAMIVWFSSSEDPEPASAEAARAPVAAEPANRPTPPKPTPDADPRRRPRTGRRGSVDRAHDRFTSRDRDAEPDRGDRSPSASRAAVARVLNRPDAPDPGDIPKDLRRAINEQISSPDGQANLTLLLKGLERRSGRATSRPVSTEQTPTTTRGKDAAPAADAEPAADPSPDADAYVPPPQGIVLSGIMSGLSGRVAMMNGRLVRPGDIVKGAKVLEVNQTSVLMEIGGRRCVVGVGTGVPTEEYVPPEDERETEEDEDEEEEESEEG